MRAQAAGVASLGPMRLEQPRIIMQKHSFPIAGAQLFQDYILTFDQRRRLLRFEKVVPSGSPLTLDVRRF